MKRKHYILIALIMMGYMGIYTTLRATHVLVHYATEEYTVDANGCVIGDRVVNHVIDRANIYQPVNEEIPPTQMGEVLNYIFIPPSLVECLYHALFDDDKTSYGDINQEFD